MLSDKGYGFNQNNQRCKGPLAEDDIPDFGLKFRTMCDLNNRTIKTLTKWYKMQKQGTVFWKKLATITSVASQFHQNRKVYPENALCIVPTAEDPTSSSFPWTT